MVEHDGTRLATLLARAGVTQSALADATNKSPTAVGKWLRKGQIARDVIVPICKTLGCSSDELLGLVPISRETQAPKVLASTQAKPTNIDLDIDALRYSIGAIAIAIASMRQAEGVKIVERLKQAPAEFLEKEGSVVALIEAVEVAVQQAKDRKRVRSRVTS